MCAGIFLHSIALALHVQYPMSTKKARKPDEIVTSQKRIGRRDLHLSSLPPPVPNVIKSVEQWKTRHLQIFLLRLFISKHTGFFYSFAIQNY
jgi:hypothetical protein